MGVDWFTPMMVAGSHFRTGRACSQARANDIHASNAEWAQINPWVEREMSWRYSCIQCVMSSINPCVECEMQCSNKLMRHIRNEFKIVMWWMWNGLIKTIRRIWNDLVMPMRQIRDEVVILVLRHLLNTYPCVKCKIGSLRASYTWKLGDVDIDYIVIIMYNI